MATEITYWVFTIAAVWLFISSLLTLLALLVFPIVMRLFFACLGGISAFALSIAISVSITPLQGLSGETFAIAAVLSLAVAAAIYYFGRGIKHPDDRNSRSGG